MRTTLLTLIISVTLLSGAPAAEENPPRASVGDQGVIKVETSALSAEIHTTGYVSGIAAGTLLDKKTGARDLGFGLDIVDFLLRPGWAGERPEGFPEYSREPKYHGHIPKQYVELPQICTHAEKVPFKIVRGDGFVAVKQWFRYTEAAPGFEPGSLWEQYLVFPEGKRYFLSCDIATSANDVDELFLRTDLPGHIKHNDGEAFEKVYLSYQGMIPSSAFAESFPPDAKFRYKRGKNEMPERMIRAYQIKMDGKPGPWLAGMTLAPDMVYDAWCHERGYVCMIQEIGGYPVKKGESFSAAYVIGFFDSVDEMREVYDRYKGWKRIRFLPDFEHAKRYEGVVDAGARTKND